MDRSQFFRRHQQWLLPLLIIVAAGIITAGLAAARGEPPKREDASAAPLVDVEAVELQPVQLTVRSQGLVTPKYETALVAQVSGDVVRIDDAFVRGGLVKKGDLLAEIDPTNYEVRVQEARAGLASAQAALELEQAQSQVARAEWDKVQGGTPPALGLRKPQLAQAQAQVTAAQAALKQAEKDLSRTRITAPYDALVGSRDISLGSFASVGTRLGSVLDVRTAEIRLPVPNSDLQYLKGDAVNAPVLLQGEVQGHTMQWQAKISRTEGVIDPDSRMSYLVAELHDPYLLYEQARQNKSSDILRFGSYVIAHIQGLSLPSAVRIPRGLVRNGRVAIAEDDKLVMKNVSVLRHEGNASIVVEGLEEGDQVITTALEFPVEGMSLDVRAPEPKDDLATSETPIAAKDRF